VEVVDRSVVLAVVPVVAPVELVVGADELVVVEISDDVASCAETILGQTQTASPSVTIIRTLRAFKSSCMESYDRAKKSEI
jgi:F420-0:gamma-glutamyl ligase